MKKIFAYLFASFDNHSKGASARKLSAFTTMLLIVYAHRFVDASNIAEVLLADGGLLCVLLGITTWEKVKLNNSTPPPTPPEEV